jgi:uncharacterized membrane protein YhhN
MSSPFRLALKLVAVASIAAAITVHFLAMPVLLWTFAPLATILIFIIAFANWTARKDSYSFWIFIGLLFSLAGDVILLRSDHFFTLGLFAFLLTHIAYLIAFTREPPFPARFSVWVLYLLFAASCYWLLYSWLPSPLHFPVAIYAVLLVSMAAQAMGRFLNLRTASAQFAAIGGLFFVLSDGLLAFDRFYKPIHLAPLLVLLPYYAAQWLIASSTDNSSPS